MWTCLNLSGQWKSGCSLQSKMRKHPFEGKLGHHTLVQVRCWSIAVSTFRVPFQMRLTGSWALWERPFSFNIQPAHPTIFPCSKPSAVSNCCFLDQCVGQIRVLESFCHIIESLRSAANFIAWISTSLEAGGIVQIGPQHPRPTRRTNRKPSTAIRKQQAFVGHGKNMCVCVFGSNKKVFSVSLCEFCGISVSATSSDWDSLGLGTGGHAQCMKNICLHAPTSISLVVVVIPISTLAHKTWALHQKKPTGRALLHRLQAQRDPNDSTYVSKSTHAAFCRET